MKIRHQKILAVCTILTVILLAGCGNIPRNPTSTPTLSEEQKMQAAQETAMAIFSMTQTQDAIDNPSPTPEPTATETPPPPPTVAAPVIPPTATEEAKPFLRVGYKDCFIKNLSGDPSHIVPYDKLYLEVCYTNDGSGTWNQNYFAQVTVNDGGNTSPLSVPLGKDVGPGQKACFSFNQNMAGYELGGHASTFALTTDGGAIIRNGYATCGWTVY